MNNHTEDIRIDNFNNTYKIIRLIANRESSKIFLVQNIHNNTLYVVKRISIIRDNNLHEQYPLEKIIREISILKYISLQGYHPNIINYIDSFKDEKYYYIITEYIRGLTLSDILYPIKDAEDEDEIEIIKYKRSIETDFELNRLSYKERYELYESIAISLYKVITYLHKHNIIHNDIVETNILIYKQNISNETRYIPVLIDFGMSSQYNETPDDETYYADLYNLRQIIKRLIDKTSIDETKLLNFANTLTKSKICDHN